MSAPISLDRNVDSEKSESAQTITQSILDRLTRTLPVRNFSIQLWDGTAIPAEGVPGFVLILTHPGSFRRMFWPPGELTLAEAYLHNDFDVAGDITAMIETAQAFESMKLAEWLWILRQAWKLPKTMPPEPNTVGRRPVKLAGSRHSRERDYRAVTYHYDTGNDFYRLFLGEWLAYSCAYFKDNEMDLDAAQAAKFDLICRKLRLKPGDRFLDIGCGWGGLVVYAAREYGVRAVGINLSQPQIDYARGWIEKLGLSERAAIKQLDYRDIRREEPYDKIASIGMVEHVGRSQLDTYFDVALSALKPGGLFLNHAIGTHGLKPDSWAGRTFLQQGQFIQQYVFPDGELVNIHAMLAAAEKAGFEVRDVESLREHYALTLRHWLTNLEANQEEAIKLTDDRTYRTWRLYMAASVRGFESGNITVFQSLLSKSHQGPSSLPLTRDDIYHSYRN